MATAVAGNWFRNKRVVDARETPFVEPRRLSLSEQWDRLATIVRGAVTRAEDAGRAHASAALQIDLAQYALISLVDELAAVMDVGDRRRRSNVHVLELQPTPPMTPRPFGDAIAA
ncbi:hypothetical protein DLM45_08450 [Hyphomicrobium methylovorum]|nr:hypothetical protein [Hyphomicrobium methylovorum]